MKHYSIPEKRIECGFCKETICQSELGGVKRGIGYFHEKCWLENMKGQVCPVCQKLDNDWCNYDFHAIRFNSKNNK